jgi:hypothetical protein
MIKIVLWLIDGYLVLFLNLKRCWPAGRSRSSFW